MHASIAGQTAFVQCRFQRTTQELYGPVFENTCNFEIYWFLGQKSISPYELEILDAKICTRVRRIVLGYPDMVNFQSPGFFLHNFTRNNHWGTSK